MKYFVTLLYEFVNGVWESWLEYILPLVVPLVEKQKNG